MATRLYMGGLGERVTEDDLRTTFSHLGSVHTVDIIRTKGRSFAYINFLPSSDNSLAKLFSTYNGCSWKGGKLKLEKAKEHYIDRLKREWAEEAELVNGEDTNCSEDENKAVSPEPKSTLDFEKMQLRMFFPKLRKVKSLPLRGTGKHKYSFQRVEVPPLPVHFCDCPEHCVPVETPKASRVRDSDMQSKMSNDKEINLMNSVMNRFLNKEISSKSKSIKPSIVAQVHDSGIQDGGMNDEEINIMNSVMKKLLDRKTVKTEQNDLHNSPKINAPTSELQEDKIEIDEEIDDDDIKINDEEIDDDDDDDDDIKINVASGQNVAYENCELQTSLVNKMVESKEQWTSDAATSKHGTENEKVKPSNRKRKPSYENRERESKESEDHLELNSVTEPETKKPITSGMWSQKSSWKELIGDHGDGSSFQLSNITSRGETNNNKEPLSGGETSSDDKKHKRVRNTVHDEHKDSGKVSSDSKELERVSNSVHESLDGQSSQSKEREGSQAAQQVGPSAGLDIAARGSSWLQKSSWTQLVGGGNSSSFSISQILPGELVENQQLNKPNDIRPPNSFYSSVPVVNEQGKSKTAFGGTRGSWSGLSGADKKKDAETSAAGGLQSSKAPKGNDHSDSAITIKSDAQQKKVSSSLSETAISDTCLFMRSADSLKEWQAAKTALTSALKKRDNKK